MHWIRTWSIRLGKLAEWVVILSFAAMGAAVAVQIFLRAAGQSLLSMEDISFFGLLWLVFTGIAVAFREQSHVTVDFALTWLPPKTRALVELFAQAMVLLFLVLFTWSGVRLTIDNVHQYAMQLRISMVYVYFIVPVGGCISLVIVLVQCWDRLEHILGKDA